MGKMNFVSGGYYGKVGQTVGQRWRNMRTVRAYVVPKNPRTEKQQENRTNFADCTGATQLAIQLNGNSLIWDNSKNTAFNNRVSESRKYADLGGAFYSYIPVIPYAYEPDYNFEPTPVLTDNVLSWTCTSQDNLDGRQMAICLQLYNSNTSKNVRHIVRTTISGSAGAWQMSYTIPAGYRLNSDSWQIGISYDDSVSALPVVYLPAYSLADIKIRTTVTASSITVNYNASTGLYEGTVTMSKALESSASPLVTATLSGVLLGESATQQTIIQSVTADGKLSFTFTPQKDSLGQRILFPAGSSCTIEAATFESDLYIYTMPNASLTFSSALVTQNWIKQVFSASPNTAGIWSVNTGITGASNVSGSLSFSMTDVNPDLSTFTVAATLDTATLSPALVFTESTASGTLTYKDAQTVALSALPTFQKAGVTYRINAESTVSIAAGSATFAVSAQSVAVTNGTATGQPTITVTCNKALPAALSLPGSLVCYGVVQAAFQTQRASVSFSVSTNKLTANPVFSTDSQGQTPHFPAGSTVTVPTMRSSVNGYAYTVAGGTFNVVEPNIPTLVYFPTITANMDIDGIPVVTLSLSGATRTQAGSFASLCIGTDENNQLITGWSLPGYLWSDMEEVDLAEGGVLYPLGLSGKMAVKIITEALFDCQGISWKLWGTAGDILQMSYTDQRTDIGFLTLTDAAVYRDVVGYIPLNSSSLAYCSASVTLPTSAQAASAYMQTSRTGTKYYFSDYAWEDNTIEIQDGVTLYMSWDIYDETLQSETRTKQTAYITDYPVTLSLKLGASSSNLYADISLVLSQFYAHS